MTTPLQACLRSLPHSARIALIREALSVLRNNDKPVAILDSRLRVKKGWFNTGDVRHPVKKVLEAFEYKIPTITTQEVEDPETGEVSLVTVRDVLIRASYGETKSHYLFPRGDLAKLEKYFGDLEWDDQRAIVDCPYTVSFISDLSGRRKKHAISARPNQSVEPATLRIDQMAVIRKWMEHLAGIFQADTGWGKTVAAIYILCLLGQKTLILVEEISCGQNWIDEFYAHTDIALVEQETGRSLIGFYGKTGKKDHFWPFITVATYQSFLRNKTLRKRRSDFGVVWGDEVDRVGAEGYSIVFSNTNSAVRGGCTATLSRNDGLERLVYDILGPPVAYGKEKMMSCKAYFVQTDVSVPVYRTHYWWTRAVAYFAGTAKKPGDKRYIDIVVQNIIRCHKRGRTQLIISDRNQFLHRIEEALRKHPEGIKLFDGNDNVIRVLRGESDRDGIIDLARRGVCKIVLGQAKLLRRAINVKPWDCLHLVTPMSGWTKMSRGSRNVEDKEVNPELAQVVGRIRRTLIGKQTPEIYDYVTAGDSRMADTAVSRSGAYRKLGFKVMGDMYPEDISPKLAKKKRGGWSSQ